jgi:hypothetical protein
MTQEILELAVGPAGSVVVLLLVLFAIWKIATSYLFPLLKEYLGNQQQNFKDLINSHSDDRQTFVSAIQSLTIRQDRVEEDLSHIKIDIKQIKDRI